MADIVQTVVGDQALRLGREEFIRPLWFGRNWSRLRVVIWFSLPYTSNVASAVLTLGVCKGNQGLRAGSTTDALAIFFTTTAGSTWTYSASPLSYATGATGAYIGQRIGTNLVTGNVGGYVGYVSPTASASCSAIADFGRLSPVGVTSMAWEAGMPNAAAAVATSAASVQNRWCAAECERLDSSLAIPYAGSLLSSTQSFSYSGAGDWDSVSVSWTNDTHKIEINDLIVVRYSV